MLWNLGSGPEVSHTQASQNNCIPEHCLGPDSPFREMLHLFICSFMKNASDESIPRSLCH